MGNGYYEELEFDFGNGKKKRAKTHDGINFKLMDVDNGVLSRGDTAFYVKFYKKHFFSVLDLTAMAQRCWMLIVYYLAKDSEYFYMSRNAMDKLLVSHFGKKYHEKNIYVSFRELVKKGYMVELIDNLWLVNHDVAFNGDRLSVIRRNEGYDLFGTRDPMARNKVNLPINYNSSVDDYLHNRVAEPYKLRDACLEYLRYKSKIRSLN